jgi:hypothetical protein
VARAALLVGLIALGGRGLATEETSCEAVCRLYPQRVKSLFGALNLRHDGLQRVRDAAAAKDWPLACKELIAYYREGENNPRPARFRDEYCVP